MIELKLNLKYLTDNYNIGTSQLKAYRGKSIKEIMEIEARKGNASASDFNLNMFSNPIELVRLFQLMSPENRLKIIKEMCFMDRLKLLSMLEKGEMLMGLNFFQKDKLIEMLGKVDKEKLLKVIQQKYSMEEFMLMIPEEFQDKFFDQEKVTPEKIIKGLQKMEPDKLARMMENVTGIPQDGDNAQDKDEMISSLSKMKPEMLKTAVKSLEQEEKAKLMFKMAEDDPSILENLDVKAYLIPLEQLQKVDLLESMKVLEEKDLLTMLAELPDDLMSITATQIDPIKFAQI